MGIIVSVCYMIIFIYSFYQWAVFLAFTLLKIYALCNVLCVLLYIYL